MRPKSIAMLAVSVLGCSLFAVLAQPPVPQAQPGPKPSAAELKKQFVAMAAMLPGPAEQLGALAPFVGEFDQVSDIRLPQGVIQVRSTGKGQWIMNKRFVKLESTSAPDEEIKGERLAVYGYDTDARKYTVWSVESQGNVAITATGDYDAATKTFSFEGERTQAGQKVPYRWILRIMEGGTIAQEIAMKAPGAPDYTTLVTVTQTPRK